MAKTKRPPHLVAISTAETLTEQIFKAGGKTTSERRVRVLEVMQKSEEVTDELKRIFDVVD